LIAGGGFDGAAVFQLIATRAFKRVLAADEVGGGGASLLKS
jgi:hypothetical protein